MSSTQLNSRTIAIRYGSTDALAIEVDPGQLGGADRGQKFKAAPGAKSALAAALLRSGVDVLESQITDAFVADIYKAAVRVDPGKENVLKKNSVPEDLLPALKSAGESTHFVSIAGSAVSAALASPAPSDRSRSVSLEFSPADVATMAAALDLLEIEPVRSAPGRKTPGTFLREQLAVEHHDVQSAMIAQFHGDIPRDKRFLIAPNIRSEPERSYLASYLDIPVDNILFLRDSTVKISAKEWAEIPHYSIKDVVVFHKTPRDAQKIREKLRDVSGASITILAHYDAGGSDKDPTIVREIPENVGGFTPSVLASALRGRALHEGRLNFFVCNAFGFAHSVAQLALEPGQHAHLTAVPRGTVITPHKNGSNVEFYYQGVPLQSDGGERVDSAAPRNFDRDRHTSLAGHFMTVEISKAAETKESV